MDAFLTRFCQRIDQTLADFPDYVFDTPTGRFSERIVDYMEQGHPGARCMELALADCHGREADQAPIPPPVQMQIMRAIVIAVNAPHAV